MLRLFEAQLLAGREQRRWLLDAETIWAFSEAQLSDWLEEQDIPLEFCAVFVPHI